MEKIAIAVKAEILEWHVIGVYGRDFGAPSEVPQLLIPNSHTIMDAIDYYGREGQRSIRLW